MATTVAEKLTRDAKYNTLVSAVGKYVVKADGKASLLPNDFTTWKLVDAKPATGTEGTDYYDYTCKTIEIVDAWLAKVIATLPVD